nr:transposase [Epibacterium ulvae]
MALHKRVRWYEERLKQVAKEDARIRLLRTIPGVGAVTASAIIASIGDEHQIKSAPSFFARATRSIPFIVYGQLSGDVAGIPHDNSVGDWRRRCRYARNIRDKST